MNQTWQELSQQIEAEISRENFSGHPKELYDPIGYTMKLGGKRIRPTLCLLANQLFQGNEQIALHLAMAIEVFHNFTLVHDDIMDEAPLRRGKAAVHKKWNRDIAILSGDVMMVMTNKLLCKAQPQHLSAILEIFNQTAIEVCEGQQLDMNFESSSTVSANDYIEMIRLKTAVLLACSLKMGAINANASEKDSSLLYNFGDKIGIAFQIQDDYLDCYANPEDFGKRVGGDIISNKKTFLYLKALEKASDSQRKEIEELTSKEIKEEEKVAKMLAIYNDLNIPDEAKLAMENYYNEAMESMNQISVSAELKQPLIDLAQMLMNRER